MSRVQGQLGSLGQASAAWRLAPPEQPCILAYACKGYRIVELLVSPARVATRAHKQPSVDHACRACCADVTIGSWMLAFNTTPYDDRRMCETNCTATSLAVYDMPQCAGEDGRGRVPCWRR